MNRKDACRPEGARAKVEKESGNTALVRPRSSRSSRLLTRLIACWPYAVFLALTLLTTAPVTLHPLHHLFSYRDPLDSAWRFAWAAHALPHDPFHLFNANTFAPHADSYLFDEMLLGAALPVLPALWLTGNAVFAFNLATLLGPLISAIGAFLLVRHLTKSTIGAVAGGIIYGFGAPHLAHIIHVGLNDAGWIPLAILLLIRLSEEPTWWGVLLFAGAVAIQTLAAFYYGFYLAFLLPATLIVLLARRQRHRHFLPAAVTGAALAVLIVAPFALTYLRVQNRYEFARSVQSTEAYSATLSSYLAAPHVNLLYGKALQPITDIGGDSVERMQFPGLIALALAGYGLWIGRRRWWARYAAGVAGVATLFSFGPNLRLTPDGPTLIPWLPYATLYEHAPGFQAMRAPGRFGILVLLGVAILAGAAVSEIAARWPTTRLRRWRLPTALLVIGALSLEVLQLPLGMVMAPVGPTPGEQWLANAPPGLVFDAPFHLDRIGGNVTDYRSTFQWNQMINGQSDLRPPAFTAVGTEMQRFPDTRSIATLQALGVRYVIARLDDTSAQGKEFVRRLRDGTIPGLHSELANDRERVYTIEPNDALRAFDAAVPAGATVLLGSTGAPIAAGAVKTDGYMAALGWRLSGARRVSDTVPAFGTAYPKPRSGETYDYLLLDRTLDPAAIGVPSGIVVWEDAFVRLYRVTAG